MTQTHDTDDTSEDDTEESSEQSMPVSRRGVIAALGAAGVFGAAGALGDEHGGDGNANLGGGPMSSAVSHLAIEWLEGSFDERPDPGVDGRFFYVTDQDDDEFGNVYRDNGSQWSIEPMGGLWQEDDDIISPRDDKPISVERTQTTQLDRTKTVGRDMEQSIGFGETLDNFEDLSEWTVVDGSMTADTDEFHRGTQSMRLEANGDTDILVERDVDLNLLRQRPSISVRAHFPFAENEFNNSNARIHFIDDNGKYARMIVPYSTLSEGDQPFVQTPVAFESAGPGGSDTIDDVDLANISKIEIRPSKFQNDDHGIWWFDMFKLTPTPSNGRLILDFEASEELRVDDYAKDLISEFGYSVSLGIPPRELDESQFDELAEFRDELGWEVRTHRSESGNIHDFSLSEFRKNIEDAKQILQENDFHRGAQHRSFLQNEAPAKFLEVTQEYYQTSRYRSGGVGFGVPTNPHLLPLARNMDDGLDSNTEERLDILAKVGGYGRMYAHPDDRLGESDLRDVLDKIKSLQEEHGLQVVPIHRVREEWLSYAETGRVAFEQATIDTLQNSRGQVDQRKTVLFDKSGEGPIDESIGAINGKDVGYEIEIKMRDGDGQTELHCRTAGEDGELYQYVAEDEDGGRTPEADESSFKLLDLGRGLTQRASGSWAIDQIEGGRTTIRNGDGYDNLGASHTIVARGSRDGSAGIDPIEIFTTNEPSEPSDLEWSLRVLEIDNR